MPANDDVLSDNLALREEVQRLQEIVLEYRKVLAFYADDDTYRDGDVALRWEPVTQKNYPDRGETARLALQQLPGPGAWVARKGAPPKDYKEMYIFETAPGKKTMVADYEVIGSIIEKKDSVEMELDGLTRRFADENDAYKYIKAIYKNTNVQYPIETAQGFVTQLHFSTEAVRKLVEYDAFEAAVEAVARQKGYPVAAAIADYKAKPEQFPTIDQSWSAVVQADAQSHFTAHLPTISYALEQWSICWKVARDLSDCVPDARAHIAGLLEEQVDDISSVKEVAVLNREFASAIQQVRDAFSPTPTHQTAGPRIAR